MNTLRRYFRKYFIKYFRATFYRLRSTLYFCFKPDNATAIASIIVALTGILGLYLVIGELRELRSQNKVLEANLRQTYRPIGVISSNPNTLDSALYVFTMIKENPNNNLLELKYYLRNYGTGVLSFIGEFSYISNEEFNFRERLLSGRIDTLIMDTFHSYMRRMTILPMAFSPSSGTTLHVAYENIRYDCKYFIYLVFLYEDQDGNLYDTEHLEVLKIANPTLLKDKPLQDQVTVYDNISKDTYHFYDNAERFRLSKSIRKLAEPRNHPLADYIAGSSNT